MTGMSRSLLGTWRQSSYFIAASKLFSAPTSQRHMSLSMHWKPKVWWPMTATRSALISCCPRVSISSLTFSILRLIRTLRSSRAGPMAITSCSTHHSWGTRSSSTSRICTRIIWVRESKLIQEELKISSSSWRFVSWSEYIWLRSKLNRSCQSESNPSKTTSCSRFWDKEHSPRCCKSGTKSTESCSQWRSYTRTRSWWTLSTMALSRPRNWLTATCTGWSRSLVNETSSACSIRGHTHSSSSCTRPLQARTIYIWFLIYAQEVICSTSSRGIRTSHQNKPGFCSLRSFLQSSIFIIMTSSIETWSLKISWSMNGVIWSWQTLDFRRRTSPNLTRPKPFVAVLNTSAQKS